MQYTISETPQPLSLPSIGWWLDNDPIPLYHGCHTANVSSILEHGLRPSPSTGSTFVSCSWQTAANYSIFGQQGEFAVVHQGAKMRVPSAADCVVLHLQLSREFVLSHGAWKKDSEMRFSMGGFTEPRLEDQELYEEYPGTDSQYYLWTELSFASVIPPDHFTAVSLPYVQPVPVFTIGELLRNQ